MKSKSLICFILLCALLVTAVLPVSGEDSSPVSAAWDGSADTSWYNTTDNTFTLTDAADLAGFAAIVNGTAEGIAQSNFLGKTVRLGADILLNTGDAASWTPETEGLQAFPIIGNISEKDGAEDASLQFSGEFDGQGHTISGLYVNGQFQLVGRFGTLCGDIRSRKAPRFCPGQLGGLSARSLQCRCRHSVCVCQIR